MRGKEREQSQGSKAPLLGGSIHNYAAFWVLRLAEPVAQKHTDMNMQK